MVRISRTIDFSSSLRYAHPDLSPEESQRLFGARASRFGHNYRLEVTLQGEPDPKTGMVMDLKELNEILEREVMARFDHRDLNDDTSLFEKRPPTPENVAAVIFGLLQEALPEGMLHRVRLQPENDVWVDVTAGTP